MKYLIILIKKTEILSALAVKMTYWTGKSKTPMHPKHLIRKNSNLWYKKYLTSKSIVLDAGCGPAQHSIPIARYVKKIYAVDKDPQSLEIARKNSEIIKIRNMDFIEMNLEKNIDFKNNFFDLIILFDVLEHIKKRQFFLAEMKRVLKSNGKILIVIPNTETTWKKLQRRYGINSYSDPDHKIEYTKKTIETEINMAGLKVRDINLVSYDTPWTGLIDLVGGFSLSLYKKISQWKQKMIRIDPENCSGFELVVVK